MTRPPKKNNPNGTLKAEDIIMPSTSQQKAIQEDSATISLMKQAEEMEPNLRTASEEIHQ